MIVQTAKTATRWAGPPSDLAVFGGSVRLYVRESVYFAYGVGGALLYVGTSNDPGHRFRAHARKSAWWPLVVAVVVIEHPDRRSAAAAEREAIETAGPLYNVAGRPGSGVPYMGGDRP